LVLAASCLRLDECIRARGAGAGFVIAWFVARRLQLLAVQSSDAEMMSSMGVRPADCPAVLLYDQQNRTKYRPSVGHQLTAAKIWLFVRSALDGKLQVHALVGTRDDNGSHFLTRDPRDPSVN